MRERERERERKVVECNDMWEKGRRICEGIEKGDVEYFAGEGGREREGEWEGGERVRMMDRNRLVWIDKVAV